MTQTAIEKLIEEGCNLVNTLAADLTPTQRKLVESFTAKVRKAVN